MKEMGLSRPKWTSTGFRVRVSDLKDKGGLMLNSTAFIWTAILPLSPHITNVDISLNRFDIF